MRAITVGITAVLFAFGMTAFASAPAATCNDAHPDHKHVHGKKCGHKEVKHGDHSDFAHDGHLHAKHENHADEHGACHKVDGHDHKHGKDCGHAAVKHGDHTDYNHDGVMHAEHDGHVDNHQG